MISSLELCPLVWSLTINGVEPLGTNEIPDLNVGHELCLEMSVINQFSYTITAFFNVQVLLDGQTTDAMMALSQTESGTVLCQPEQKIQHSLEILPLTSGVYDVICSCTIVKINSEEKQTRDSLTDNNDFVSNYPKIKIHINDT